MPSFQASPQALNQIKQRRKARGWAIDDRQWLVEASQILEPSQDWAVQASVGKGIFASGVSLSTWKRFLRGESIHARVFLAFCQVLDLDWQTVVQTEAAVEEAIAKTSSVPVPDVVATTTKVPHQDWGESPNVSLFYGREPELTVLQSWVMHDRCQVIAVLGMGGMGKTTLLTKLARQVLEANTDQPFDFVIWRSLLNALPIEEVLLDWIRFFSDQQETQLPERLDAQLSRLRHYLQIHRCLLILDNFETVLTGGVYTGAYQVGYEGYGQLLEQIGTVAHRSCLLITSREKPQEVVKLEGKNRPVRSLALQGLSQVEAQHIFADVGEFTASEAEWQELTDLYSGNPLGLELVAKHIQQVFEGNIHQFLSDRKPIFYDLLALLDRHFQRLSEQEQEVIYWFAIQREPVPLDMIRTQLRCPITQTEIGNILLSLQRRWALARTKDGWTLQPVLLEYVTGKLVNQFVADIEQGKLSVFNQYAILQTTAKEYIRAAQQRLIVKQIATLAIARSGSQTFVETQLQYLLAILRVTSQPPGYAAGNVLNLLCFLKSDLRGYDFSHLPIWQADLQGATLQDVNFTGAQFSHTVFTQTFGNVLSVAFSPDGTTLATGNADGNIYLWQVEDGQHCGTLRGHTNWIRGISFSPDGNRLVSGSEDQTIKVWDLQDGVCTRTIHGHSLNLNTVTLSPDGQTIASASNDQTIRLWDRQTGACLRVMEGHQHWVVCATFSPDGQYVISGSADQTLRLWEVATGQCLRVFTGHESWVVPAVFNAQGDRIVSAGFDQTVRIWDVATGTCLHILRGHTDWIWSVSCSPDQRLIASTGVDQTIRIWDAETGICLQAIQAHTKQVWGVMFHPDSQRLASCGEDQTIRLWDVATGHCLRLIKGYANWIRSLRFSPDQQKIFTAHHDTTIKCWDAQTARWLFALRGHTDSVMAIAVSSDGQYLASAADDRTVRLWSIADQRCVQVFTGHTQGVWAITFSTDNRQIISAGCDYTLRVWQIESATCLHVLRGHRDRILDLAVHPSTGLVASVSEDQTIKFWNIQTGECVQTLTDETRVLAAAFSPDGKILATGGIGTIIKVWDVSTGMLLHTLVGHTGWILALAFHPEGQHLVSGASDHTVQVWDLATQDCLQTLKHHQNWVWSVAYSLDGAVIASASEDETIALWQAQTSQLLATGRSQGPYEGMIMAGVTGLNSAQISTLLRLGATDGHHSTRSGDSHDV